MSTQVVVLEHGEIGESVMKQQSKGLDAMFAPKETLIYVTAIYSGTGREKPDFVATVDVDPNSPTYSKIIHRLHISYLGDELHRTGWNSCSSCYGDPYVIVEPEDIRRKTGLASSHCLASGNTMISFLGDKDGNAAGSGFLFDSEFNVKGRWEKPGHSPLFGYDFWYQPQHKTDKHIMGCSCCFHQRFLTYSMSLMAFMRNIYMYTANMRVNSNKY